MRLITTIVLGVTSVVLAVVIYFVDRQTALAHTDPNLANVLIRFEPDRVDRIEIKNSDGTVRMDRTQGYWFFTSPEVDRVDPNDASVLLDQLNHLTLVDEISAGEIEGKPELNISKLGLDAENAIEVTLSGPEKEGSNDRKSFEIVLGTSTPLANTIYARRGFGSKDALVVDGNPRKFLENVIEEMRDRRLLGAPSEGIVQLLIRDSRGEIAMQRRVTPPVQDWTLLRPLKAWADKEKLDQLLADLSSLQIQSVAEGEREPLNIPNPLPERSAVIQLAVFGMEKPLTIYLKEVPNSVPEGSPIPPTLEARVSDRPATYLLQSNFIKNLPTDANALRERSLARVPLQYLDFVRVQSRIDPEVVLKSKKYSDGRIAWDVYLNGKLLPANLGRVRGLVEGVNEASVLNFVSDSADDFASYGLDPPAKKVTFQLTYPGKVDENGETGPSEPVTRILRLGWKEDDEQRLYANFEGSSSIYELDPTFANLIPTHPIKWRSLNVLTFNPYHLKEITREQVGQTPLQLKYKYKRDEWEAYRAGTDITTSLDRLGARKLGQRLSSLTAISWNLSLQQAYAELKNNPVAKFTIVYGELDQATNDSKNRTRELVIARAAGDTFFGQITGSPDVFLLDHNTFGNLIKPVTTFTASPP